MKKIMFQSDYTEGAHPRIMEKLMATNLEQTSGYGEDEYCAAAAKLIRKACNDENLDVHFLVGGTQTNMTVIDAALRSYQGVICADTGHINVHETGAVESCGHKVLGLPHRDGKISAKQIEETAKTHFEGGSPEHTVQPKMVYISNPTELGTIYSLQELQDISEVCRRYGMYLFLDGARLGYGLTASDNTLSLETIAKYTDVFYIGGTKVGALFGEAVVISNAELKQDFRYFIKQKGGMLAKGRLLGIQFKELFQEDLYFTISRQADILAEQIRVAMEAKGYTFVAPNHTNQIFVIIPDGDLEILGHNFEYNMDHRVDENRCCVRFCTSWATTTEQAEKLITAIEEL